MKGVDISHYQNGLTIQQIRDSGGEFAIIKLTEGSYLVDAAAFGFYREAYETGFPMGCYCYSHAVNAPQARAEAAFLLDNLHGFPMPCGIYLDVEENDQLALSSRDLKNVILGWCETIRAAGYIPGVYGSEGNLWAKVSPNELPDGTLIWVARWSNSAPNTPCDLWQTSDNGRIDGYDGPVDTDITRGNRITALAETAAQDYDRHRKRLQSANVQPVEAPSAEARPSPSEKAVIPILQLLMSYFGYWGEVDGQKSPEFFTAARTFLDDLERG